MSSLQCQIGHITDLVKSLFRIKNHITHISPNLNLLLEQIDIATLPNMSKLIHMKYQKSVKNGSYDIKYIKIRGELDQCLVSPEHYKN